MNRRHITSLTALAVAMVSLILGGQQVYRNAPRADVNNGPFDESLVEVVNVVDGDTFKAQDQQSHVIKTVRLIGMDTPETKDPRKPVQYYGKEASDYAKQLLFHRNVTLKKDVSETDKYSRLLRYVYLGDGTFVNEKLVREGYARVSTFPPDVQYTDLLKAAEQDARQHKRGLWQ